MDDHTNTSRPSAQLFAVILIAVLHLVASPVGAARSAKLDLDRGRSALADLDYPAAEAAFHRALTSRRIAPRDRLVALEGRCIALAYEGSIGAARRACADFANTPGSADSFAIDEIHTALRRKFGRATDWAIDQGQVDDARTLASLYASLPGAKGPLVHEWASRIEAIDHERAAAAGAAAAAELAEAEFRAAEEGSRSATRSTRTFGDADTPHPNAPISRAAIESQPLAASIVFLAFLCVVAMFLLLPWAPLADPVALMNAPGLSAGVNEAQRTTSRLMVGFGFAILTVIVAVNAAVLPGIWHPQDDVFPLFGSPALGVVVTALTSIECAYVSLAVLLLILVVAAWNEFMLGGDGAVVAKWLGGEELLVDDPEGSLVTITHEVARTADIPLPRVFVQREELGLNAFAAGSVERGSAVCVTRGLLDALCENELRGVLAHEIAHIRNDDSRLNTRLIALLAGISAIGVLGAALIAFGAITEQAEAQRPKKKDDQGGSGAGLIIIGLAALVIGAIGAWCANVIRSAVSRTREQLADVTAVHLLGNREDLGNALKKLWAAENGSRVHHPKAAAAAHLFFGDAGAYGFGGFATHPPIEDRIQAIFPEWTPTEAEARALRAVGSRGKWGSRLGLGLAHPDLWIRETRLQSFFENSTYAEQRRLGIAFSGTSDKARARANGPAPIADALADWEAQYRAKAKRDGYQYIVNQHGDTDDARPDDRRIIDWTTVRIGLERVADTVDMVGVAAEAIYISHRSNPQHAKTTVENFLALQVYDGRTEGHALYAARFFGDEGADIWLYSNHPACDLPFGRLIEALAPTEIWIHPTPGAKILPHGAAMIRQTLEESLERRGKGSRRIDEWEVEDAGYLRFRFESQVRPVMQS